MTQARSALQEHEQNWDAIIVGSGLGGMTCATLLAMAGRRVLLLEQHDVPGGFTHTFKRKGYVWDVGVHYVGQVTNEKSFVRKIFDYVSGSELKWASVGDVYDQGFVQGERFDCEAGREHHLQNLIAKFPDEAQGLREYFAEVKSAARSSAWFFGEKTMPPFLSRTAGRLLRRKFEHYAKLTTSEVIARSIRTPELKALLCLQCGDYGLSPHQSSFAIHAAVIDHYIDGAAYPVGGAGSLPDTIIKNFKRYGGTLRVKADVKEIVLSKEGRVTGVRLKDGEMLRSNVVVSNAGFRNTFTKLLKPAQLPADYRREVEQTLKDVAPSTAHFCLYVGLNASDADLNLPKHNIWLYDSINLLVSDSSTPPTPDERRALTYISFASAKDPEWSSKHPGKSTIQVICACDMSEVQKWKDSRWRKRGDDYEVFKAGWSKTLLEKLLLAMPALKNHIAYTELSTPLSTEHFMHYTNGEIYGLEHTPARFQSRALRPQTPVKGLFLTGQDIVVVGVSGALYSGVLAATVVLKKALMARILLNRPLA